MSINNKLLTVKDALQLDRKTTTRNYKEYVNPGLAMLMHLLDFDKLFVRASGTRVWDSEGVSYLDFLGGYGSLNLGHNHPAVIEAIEQVKELPNLLQAAISPLAGALAKNIAAINTGGLKHTFFSNSGAEAVEGALKLARAATAKTRIIATEDSFHGKTLGALSVTGRAKYQKPFKPLVPDVTFIPFGDAAALEAALSAGNCAAFIVEPIQGEGGIILPPAGYLSRARELCSSYQTLLIMDEIQTGFGRTGFNFAYEEEGAVPDVLCLAKSLGGGIMPIGACVTTAKHWEKAYGGVDKCLLHTSTFGGNTWAMAAGIAAINILVKENLATEARQKGAYLLKAVKSLQEKYEIIKDVRGRGLLLGIEFASSEGILNKVSSGMLNKLSNEYLGAMVAGELQNDYQIITAYTLNNPNVIRLEPPLTVTYEELDIVIEALDKIFSKKKGLTGFMMKTGKTAVSAIFKR